jgi:hypothetical protein
MRLAGLAVIAGLCLSHAAQAREVPLPLIALRDRVPGEIKAGQTIEFDALARYRGEELKLFHSERGEQFDLIYPYCISANGHDLDYADRQALVGKWVRVAGTLIEADELATKWGLFLVSDDDLQFHNDCFGAYVLRIETIAEIDPAPYAPRDCVPNTANFCIPREYDDYWLWRGMLIRQPPPKLGGLITIHVEAIDNFAEQPVTGMVRRELGDYVVFYDFACQTETLCRLTTAPTARYGLAVAESRGLIHRTIEIASKDKAAMDAALTKLRYCPAGGCEGGPSVSLAELTREQP